MDAPQLRAMPIGWFEFGTPAKGGLLRRLDGAYGAVQAVVLSGDGKLISAYDVLGVLSQWNVADGRLVRQSIVRPTTETDIPAPVVPGAAVPAPPVPAPAPRARPMPKVQPDSARIEPSQKLAPNGARFQIQSGTPTVFRFAAAEGDSQSDNPNAPNPVKYLEGRPSKSIAIPASSVPLAFPAMAAVW